MRGNEDVTGAGEMEISSKDAERWRTNIENRLIYGYSHGDLCLL